MQSSSFPSPLLGFCFTLRDLPIALAATTAESTRPAGAVTQRGARDRAVQLAGKAGHPGSSAKLIVGSYWHSSFCYTNSLPSTFISLPGRFRFTGETIICLCQLLCDFCILFRQDFSCNNISANGQSSPPPVYNTFPLTPTRRALTPHHKHYGIKP